MTINVPEIEQLISMVAALAEEIAALRSAVRPEKAWYTLDECCAMKGVNKSTLTKHRFLMPPHPTKVGKRSMYPAESVHEWLSKSDDQIEREYRAFNKSA